MKRLHKVAVATVALEALGAAYSLLLLPRCAFLLEPVHFVMEWGMLRGIRARAERAARRPPPAFAAAPPRCTLGFPPRARGSSHQWRSETEAA